MVTTDSGTALSSERGFGLVELLMVMVVTLLTIGAAAQIFTGASQSYTQQRSRIDAGHNARATVDMIARLVRMAQTVAPDPDVNGVMDSIRLVGDWNPADGDTNDSYEDVTFTTQGGTLFKREPADPARVAFADSTASITFTYFDTNNVAIASPVANAAQIALVRIQFVSTAMTDGPALTLRSSATVRRRE